MRRKRNTNVSSYFKKMFHKDSWKCKTSIYVLMESNRLGPFDNKQPFLIALCFISEFCFRRLFKSSFIFSLAPHFLYPFSRVANMGSIYMTVSISFERYLAVCQRHLGDRKQWYYVIPVTIFAIAVNIPKFWIFQLEHCDGDISVKTSSLVKSLSFIE